MTYREDQFRDPGRLNTRVEVLTAAEPVDDFNGTPALATLRSCWAEWVPLRGDRLQVYQQQYGAVTSEVVLRQMGTVPIKSGMFLKRVRDGKLAAIAGVIPVDGGDRWLQLVVREIE